MNHAELCLVCKGTGKVDELTCHGCQGRGWVEVGSGQFVPYTPQPAPWYPDTNPWLPVVEYFRYTWDVPYTGDPPAWEPYIPYCCETSTTTGA